MKLSTFDYPLPEELIAQHPAQRREEARLMVVRRASGEIEHRHCADLPALLSPQDLCALNDSRVFPARLLGRCGRRPIEVLLVRDLGHSCWEALLKPGRKVKAGQEIVFEAGVLVAQALPAKAGPLRQLRFHCKGSFWETLERLGEVPLPPYIRRPLGALEEDRSRYQTVYARARGSIAAPTAGLHFTTDLLCQLRHCFVTLHVGYGTFKPVTADEIEEHRMEAESFSVTRQTASALTNQLAAAKRVVTVGTTTTRVLEHLWRERGRIVAGEGTTDLYIYPGFEFRVAGGLLTNFHLPRSSLFLLVSAFAGVDLIRESYRVAVERQYRFYSFGDAMLIL